MADDAVQRWISNGAVKPYRNLPPEYQKAIAHYMARDGEAWEGPEHWYDTDKPVPPNWESDLPHFVQNYGAKPFGMTQIPLEELKRAVMGGQDMAEHGSFDNWLNWYGSHFEEDAKHGRGVPTDSQEIWPITLDDTYGDVLQDGWHRLHNYATRGIDPVPALYFPREF